MKALVSSSKWLRILTARTEGPCLSHLGGLTSEAGILAIC